MPATDAVETCDKLEVHLLAIVQAYRSAVQSVGGGGSFVGVGGSGVSVGGSGCVVGVSSGGWPDPGG